MIDKFESEGREMGCDIHAYVEHRPRNSDSKTWWPFGGRINPGRNYDVFEKLAGVRGELSNALVQPRGLPEDLSWESSGDYWHWITYKGVVCDGAVLPATAEAWNRHGAPYKGTVGDKDAQPRYVGDPDAHTPSWVTVDEFESALDAATRYGANVEYRALLAAMRVLESDNRDVRVVFWFDN